MANTSIAFPQYGQYGGQVVPILAVDNGDGTYSLATVAYNQSYKAPVRVATTGAGTLATSFANGQTVDGIVLVTGDRILIKNQASAPTNGIYTVNASGAPARATDFNEWNEIPGAVVGVLIGTVNADTAWICTSDSGGTLGVTDINFSAFGNTFNPHSPGPIGDVAPGTIAGTIVTVDRILFTGALGARLSDRGNGAVDLTTADGGAWVSFNAGVISATTSVGVGTTLSIGGGNAVLAGPAANTLALRNAANGQTLLVGGTYTDGSNYVQASLAATSTTVTLAALTAGTGADNIDITLTPAGTGVLAVGNAASADVLVASTHTALIKFNGVSYKVLLATP